MALHFDLRVNNEIIGSMELVRIDPVNVNVATIDPDTECTYKVGIQGPLLRYNNTTKHRFGDGAWSLIHKALGEYLDA